MDSDDQTLMIIKATLFHDAWQSTNMMLEEFEHICGLKPAYPFFQGGEHIFRFHVCDVQKFQQARLRHGF